MKIKSSYKLIFCLMAFTIKAHGDDTSFQERVNAAQATASVAKLSALSTECETLWPSNATLYFQSANKVGEAFEILAKTNSAALHALENQSESVLSKPCPKGARAANDCFKSKFSIAERFVRASVSTPDLRGTKILAKFLGEVRTTLNTNYHFKMEEMNVEPPIAPTNGLIMAGMDPNAISDPIARAVYLKAIDDNAQIGDENDLQLHTLPEINKTITLYFFNYIKMLVAQNPEAKNQPSLSALAHLTKDEQRQLQ